jgi:predicted PolB exonuclease-like 3'-5' exonuclease
MKIYANIKNFLFLDIETVREFKDYATLLQNNRSAGNWTRIANRFMKEEGLTVEGAYEKKASLYVEYGRIVSICFGMFDSEFNHKIGAISDQNEETLLRNAADYLDKYYAKYPETILCGHNIKEFDIPFMIKRMIKYRIRIPRLFMVYLTAKSWEQPVTDTQYDWRMAGNRFMALDGIAEYLGIPSSKTGEVSGENLGEYYWNNADPIEVKLEKINTYCKADVRVSMDFAKYIYDVI